MLKRFFKNKIQKGQSMVFFAIALPTLFMFVAAVIEFGWWFLNQSRLQNAADAAVLAGAEKIVSAAKDSNLSSTKKIIFQVDFVNKVPPNYSASQIATPGDAVAKTYADKNFYYSETEPEYAAYYNSFKHYTYGDITNFNPAYYAVELQGKAKHLFGILDNFGDMNLKAVAVARITEDVDAILEGLKVQNVITGNWEIQNLYQGLTYEADEYGTPIRDKDGVIKYKNDANKAYAADHNSAAGANSALKAFHDASGLDFLFTGKWNHYKEPSKRIYYHDGDEFRTEVVDVYVTRDLLGNTTYTKKEKINGVDTEVEKIIEYGSAFKTPANGSNQWSWKELVSINLDFAQDFAINLKNLKSGTSAYYSLSDWDIGYKLPPDIQSISPYATATSKDTIFPINPTDGWGEKRLNHRIHALITFYEAFPWIAKTVDADGKEDENGEYYYNPLWARIESEPMWSFLGNDSKGNPKRQNGLDSVHQIIININAKNWMKEKDGHPIPLTKEDPEYPEGKYNTDEPIIYRPIVFFYDGPETNSTNIYLDAAKHPSTYNGATRPNTRYPTRASLPVILNLNADFAGILYMPNSAVCVVTNGHKFRGFIRAKEYKILDTDGTPISHPTKDFNGDLLESPTLYIKTVTDYNPTATASDKAYVKEVHGEVQFKDATAAQVKSSLPDGSEYSIFNIKALKDSYFDNTNSYSVSESGDIIMTTQD